ncbi:MAG: hypothetical protein EOP82_29420 [Variovorax sp.]|nr:MAG: hypothetical protein EOP82_29420 [Variovorax sp.]
MAAPIVKDEHRNFGPLVLLELTSLIAEHFHSVQTISFVLSREIETYGNGMKVASARSQLLGGFKSEVQQLSY